MSDRLWIVLPCAGSGARFSAAGAVAKQYALLGVRAVLTVVLERMLELDPVRIVLVVAEGDDAWHSCVPPAAHGRVVSATGGAERAASVLSGLRGLAGHAADTDWVMVHDVARPCVTRADCVRLLAAVANDAAGGLLALPVTDTVKQVGSDEHGVFALRTVPRDDLWSAQTPQVFRFGVLRQALLAAMASGAPITDEASAVEQLGFKPRLVRGSATNLKITWPEDLARAAVIIAAQAGSA